MFLAHDPQTLQEVFQAGGPVMWPLLAVSVLGLAVITERGIHFARRRLAFSRFVDELSSAIRGDDLKSARDAAARRHHPLARLAEHFLACSESSPAQRADLVKREGGMLLESAERRLPLLRLVVQIAPILGLLGTVQGLLLAFWALESIQGPIRPADVAGGIGSALTTTVFGLSIAIPASGCLLLFEEQVDRLARRMGFLASHLEEALESRNSERPAGNPTPSTRHRRPAADVQPPNADAGAGEDDLNDDPTTPSPRPSV